MRKLSIPINRASRSASRVVVLVVSCLVALIASLTAGVAPANAAAPTYSWVQACFRLQTWGSSTSGPLTAPYYNATARARLDVWFDGRWQEMNASAMGSNGCASIPVPAGTGYAWRIRVEDRHAGLRYSGVSTWAYVERAGLIYQLGTFPVRASY